MNNFLADLLHDLREKRLAPVAAVLLVALVAVPLVLSKGSEPAPPSTQGADAAPKATPTIVKAVDRGPEPGGSDLGVFNKRDPFKSGVKLKKSELADGVAQLVNPAAAGGGSAVKPSTGSTSGGGGSSPSSGTSPAPTATPSPTTTPRTVTPKKVSYVYIADVTFTRGPHSRRIRRLHRLDMLPSEESPSLIFLGVTAKGNSAVFLVDSTLKAEGEGHCRPSADQCATLSIGPGSEHAFVQPDGTTLTLTVNEIRKVRLARASASSRKGARARASVGHTRRRFVPPVLADIVTVARPTSDSSSQAKGGR